MESDRYFLWLNGTCGLELGGPLTRWQRVRCWLCGYSYEHRPAHSAEGNDHE